MPQTDIMVIGFKSISVVFVFLTFLFYFIYTNSFQIANLFKILTQFKKNTLLFVSFTNFKNAVTTHRKHLSFDFLKIIC